MSPEYDERDPYYGHWADQAARRTVRANPDATALVVAAGITPSGVVHVGNFREIITVDLVARALRDRGLDVRFIYSWDDFDVFRRVPVDHPNQALLEENLRRSIADVPDPFEDGHESYASHHISAVEASVARLGIRPEFIRQAARYRAGVYAEGTRRALEHSSEIRAILDRHRADPLAEDWLPLAGFCDACGRDDLAFRWPGEWTAHYSCASCGHEGKTDLREGGDVKLVWRVDWPMRWVHEGVLFEPGGKDHSSAGGSYDTAREIVAAVYGGEAPVYVAYDDVRSKGRGGKISSSKGTAVTVDDCLEIYEPDMLRWLFASTRPNTEMQISFDLDVIKLYEDFDRARRLAHERESGGRADRRRIAARRVLHFASIDHERVEPGSPMPFRPAVRHLSILLQVYDGDVERTLEHYEKSGAVTTDAERGAFRTRALCIWSWILRHAPDDFRYRIRIEPVTRPLDADQRTVLGRLVDALERHPEIDEAALIPHLKSMCDGTDLTPQSFFPLAYDLLLDRPKGPKLSTLIPTMGAERARRLLAASLDAVAD